MGNSIYQNLEALIREKWDQYSMTGSALNHFSCSRQDAGSYAACNISRLTRIVKYNRFFKRIQRSQLWFYVLNFNSFLSNYCSNEA